jgi:hypothetical protein
MEVIRVIVPIRGEEYELEAPGPDAPPEIAIVANMNMLILALIALDDPKVDAVLGAFQFEIETGSGRRIFPPG